MTSPRSLLHCLWQLDSDWSQTQIQTGPDPSGFSHLETSLKVMNQIVQQKVLHVLCGRDRMAPPTHRHHCSHDTIVAGLVPQPSCKWIVAFPCLQMFAKSHNEFAVILCGSEGKTSACCVQAWTNTAHTSPPLPFLFPPPPLPSPFTSSPPYFSSETCNDREISPSTASADCIPSHLQWAGPPVTCLSHDLDPFQSLMPWWCPWTCWPKPRRAGRRWGHSKCSSSLTPLPGTVTTD